MPKLMNLKKLTEQRDAKAAEMKELLDGATKEERALNEEEVSKFEQLDEEIRQLDTTIAAEKRVAELKLNVTSNEHHEELTVEQREYQEFGDFLRDKFNKVETRADVNYTKGDNGTVIPATIATKIIETVHELSDIYSRCTVYNVKGTLTFPVYDDTNGTVTMAYADEFTDLTASGGKFTNVSLTGFLAGALAKVSRSLMNNSQFDIVPFVIKEVAKSIVLFMEGELINGTSGKMTGLVSTTKGITAASATAITTDELIELQATVPTVYQESSVFLMHKDTFTAIRKLKDDDGHYMLQPDIRQGFGWVLLGRPVLISEKMPTIATGKKAIIYGDLTGLYVKLTEEAQVQVLTELFAAQHVVGVVAWVEADSKIVEPQKLAALTMA